MLYAKNGWELELNSPSTSDYFVVRFQYNVFNSLREELLKGRLRIPWGFAGLDLRNKENFVAAYVEFLKENNPDETEEELTNEAVKHYSRLLILTKIKIGDIILIPRVSIHQSEVGKYFTVAEVSAEYSFEPMPEHNDFGHVIGVKLLGTFDYYSENMAESYIGNNLISSFRSRIVSRINNPDMIRCVEELLGLQKSPQGTFGAFARNRVKRFNQLISQLQEDAIRYGPLKSQENVFDSVMNRILEMQESYLEGLLKLLQNLPPDDPSRNEISQKILNALRMFSPDELKNVVKKLFIRKDHRLLGEDSSFLSFELFSERELMQDFCKPDEPRKIFVYLRNSDMTCAEAIEQAAKNDAKDFRILIDLTEQFDAETVAKAAERNVILINGLTFANILARHQINDNRIVGT